MTVTYGDRVQETFTTTGTGTISLGGAVTGYQAFSAVMANAGTCYYGATDGTNWEVGLGTFASAGDTLARTTVLASSNGGSAVNWAAGTKSIWLDFPAAAANMITPSNYYSSGVSSPTGTTNTTAKMMGLGGAITPNGSGNIFASLCGTLASSVNTDGGTVSLYYGSGTAPINGATLTGTQIGGFCSDNSITNATPFNVSGIAHGLVAGTTYWIDAALAAVTGGTASVQNVQLSAFEVK